MAGWWETDPGEGGGCVRGKNVEGMDMKLRKNKLLKKKEKPVG